jgi:hypothetical protein
MSATATSPLRYRGWRSTYADVASRNGNEFLGLSIEYAAHPSGIGCFILRFIVHGKGVDPKNYKHLTYREMAEFVIPGGEGKSSEKFKGLRLNKIAVPVFSPAVFRHEVDEFATKFNLWPVLTEWIAEQIAAEGFTVTVENLQETIRSLAILPSSEAGAVKSVLEFPDLNAPEQKVFAMKQAKKPAPEPTEDEDLDDEDGDGDEEDKEWLN